MLNHDIQNKIIETGGDLSGLTRDELGDYYRAFCVKWELDPTPMPLAYFWRTENGRRELRLYIRRTATDQLRRAHDISISVNLPTSDTNDYVVTAIATTPDGRREDDIGAVNLAGLTGPELANAKKRAVTQAKRRVTLAMLGVGLPDESEIPDIRGAAPVRRSSPVESLKDRIMKHIRALEKTDGWFASLADAFRAAVSVPDDFDSWVETWGTKLPAFLDDQPPGYLIGILNSIEISAVESKSDLVAKRIREAAKC